jgi:aerobic carbon-monoxide dehydrogenase large subunit
MRPMKFGVGQPIRRLEDQRFITGAGRYTSDLIPANALHGFVLRSPHAHASFRFTDLATARAIKGVKLILTHEDIAHLGDLPCKGLIQTTDGTPVKPTPHPILAKGTVRHVGEAVAFIVADTVNKARDAAEAIGIDYTVLPAITGIAAATAKGAPQVWPDRPGNIAFTAEQGNKARTDAAFAKAASTVSMTIVNNRLVSSYMETRAAIAEYDTKTKRFTLTLGSQGSHGVRDLLCNSVFKIDPSRMRVITPDVGGGFGTKIFLYSEYPLVLTAAEKLKRPIAWVAERTEHFLADTHGRANLATATMALDAKGKFLGLRVQLDADMGAMLSQYGPFIPWVGTTMTSGCYDIPAVHVVFRGVLTHTTPVDAYRGAGRPEAAYLIERLVDEIALKTGRKPEAVRTQNFVKPKQMPYKTQTGPTYDSGEFDGHMRQAMMRADWAGFPARARKAAKAGKLRGIGLACYIEACGGGGPESAWVTIEADGSATVKIGTQSNGQGHETAYAQLVSQELDLPLDKIKVLQGDTDQIEHGSGTGGSRSIPVGGAALAHASRTLADNLKKLAADKLETATSDLEIAAGEGDDLRHRQGAELCRDRGAAGRDGGDADRQGHLEAAGSDLSERNPCGRGGDRRRHGRNPHRQLLRGRRFRRCAQSADAGRAGPWWRGAGHRPGADGRGALRRRRADADGELHGLCHAARRRRAKLLVRDAQRALRDQRARRQGCWRSWRHRGVPGGHERTGGCLEEGGQTDLHRHARNAGQAAQVDRLR